MNFQAGQHGPQLNGSSLDDGHVTPEGGQFLFSGSQPNDSKVRPEEVVAVQYVQTAISTEVALHFINLRRLLPEMILNDGSVPDHIQVQLEVQKAQIAALFGAGSFEDLQEEVFDVLVVETVDRALELRRQNLTVFDNGMMQDCVAAILDGMARTGQRAAEVWEGLRSHRVNRGATDAA